MEQKNEAWRQYAADFNAMTDKEVEDETERSRREVEEHESWLEAVASWEAAGKPRNTAPAPGKGHSERQEGDEYYCPKCNKRWDTHEEAPPCVD